MRKWNAVCTVTLVLSRMDIILNTLYDSFKPVIIRSGLYILMQKELTLNISHIVRKHLVE
jgi:hypothetical protein